MYRALVRLVAEHDGERALARLAVGRDVAQVVDDQQSAGEQADRPPRPPRAAR